jgi:hypothetical protein
LKRLTLESLSVEIPLEGGRLAWHKSTAHDG